MAKLEHTYIGVAKWNFYRIKKVPRNRKSYEYAMYWALLLAAEAGEL